MGGRTEIRTDRPSPDGRPTCTGSPKKLALGVPKKLALGPKKKLALEGQKMKDRRRFLRSTLKNPQGGAKKMRKSTALIIIIEICLVHYDVLIKENIISLQFKKVFL